MIKTHHSPDGHVLQISAFFEGALHTLMAKTFSQNLSTNSAEWQKLLFNLLACSEVIMRNLGHGGLRTKSSKVSLACVRWC